MWYTKQGSSRSLDECSIGKNPRNMFPPENNILWNVKMILMWNDIKAWFLGKLSSFCIGPRDNFEWLVRWIFLHTCGFHLTRAVGWFDFRCLKNRYYFFPFLNFTSYIICIVVEISRFTDHIFCMYTLADIDELSSNYLNWCQTGTDLHLRCINTQGTYYCWCPCSLNQMRRAGRVRVSTLFYKHFQMFHLSFIDFLNWNSFRKKL